MNFSSKSFGSKNSPTILSFQFILSFNQNNFFIIKKERKKREKDGKSSKKFKTEF